MKLAVGQVWRVINPVIDDELIWNFEIVSKITTTEGARFIAVKHNTPVHVNGSLAVFTEEGSPAPGELDVWNWRLLERSKAKPRYI